MSTPPRIIINPYENNLEDANDETQKNLNNIIEITLIWVLTFLSPVIWYFIYHFVKNNNILNISTEFIMIMGTFGTFGLALGAFAGTIVKLGYA